MDTSSFMDTSEIERQKGMETPKVIVPTGTEATSVPEEAAPRESGGLTPQASEAESDFVQRTTGRVYLVMQERRAHQESLRDMSTLISQVAAGGGATGKSTYEDELLDKNFSTELYQHFDELFPKETGPEEIQMLKTVLNAKRLGKLGEVPAATLARFQQLTGVNPNDAKEWKALQLKLANGLIQGARITASTQKVLKGQEEKETTVVGSTPGVLPNELIRKKRVEKRPLPTDAAEKRKEEKRRREELIAGMTPAIKALMIAPPAALAYMLIFGVSRLIHYSKTLESKQTVKVKFDKEGKMNATFFSGKPTRGDCAFVAGAYLNRYATTDNNGLVSPPKIDNKFSERTRFLMSEAYLNYGIAPTLEPRLQGVEDEIPQEFRDSVAKQLGKTTDQVKNMTLQEYIDEREKRLKNAGQLRSTPPPVPRKQETAEEERKRKGGPKASASVALEDTLRPKTP